MRDRHAQDGELVRLAGQRAAGRHHVRQLRDVGGHLVPSPPLYLAVVLPAADKQTSVKSKRNQYYSNPWQTVDVVGGMWVKLDRVWVSEEIDVCTEIESIAKGFTCVSWRGWWRWLSGVGGEIGGTLFDDGVL